MPFPAARSIQIRLAACLSLACAAVACRDPDQVRIGDGIPRAIEGHTFDNLMQAVFDSMPPGRRVTVIGWKYASGTEVDQAMAGAQQFSSVANLIGVVGHAGSRDALLAATVYNSAGVPQLVPTGTSRRLGLAGPWTFTLVPNDSVEGAFLGTYALDSVHASRVAVFYLGDEYGIGLRDGIRSAMMARHQAPVDETMLAGFSCDRGDFERLHRFTILAALRRSHPDVVILATGMMSARCVIRIIKHERPDMWILGGDGIETSFDPSHSLPGEQRERIRSVVFWTPANDPENTLFQARVQRVLHRKPTAAYALAYDGMLLLATAAREGGGNRAAVRRWLESLGRTRPPFHGVTGPISFDHGRVGARLQMMPPDSAP